MKLSWLKTFFGVLMFTMPGFCKSPDYKPIIESVFDKTKLFFDPYTVEDVLFRNFSDSSKYSIFAAAMAYDSIAEETEGYMSAEDLFYVCYRARLSISIDLEDSNWRTDVWNDCKQGFITDLLNTSEDASFIDDYITDVYDGSVFNQPCTPPRYYDKDETVQTINMVCTTGKHANEDPAFEKAMITKFRTEGGCAYVPDGNGKTCYGVAGKYYPEVYREKPKFTRADAENIAWRDFYKKYNMHLLPDAIRGDVFMALWGTGKTSSSIGLLQDILGVEKTNKVDEATIAAARDYKGLNLRRQFLKMRWERNKNNKTFSNGWARAFLIYMQNGCHSVTDTPLERNKTTEAECSKHL